MSVFDWLTTASSNGNSDASINFQENQAPSTVNDSARALMARVAYWVKMFSGNNTQGGSSNAYTITTGESLSAYAANMRFLWTPNADSTGASTLNVDAIGAKKVYLPTGVQAGSGDIESNAIYDVVYQTALDSAAGGFKIVGSDTGAEALAVANAALPSSSYTAADVLTKIKTVDGAGSGLDADTVDGVEASALARLTANTFIDNQTISSTNPRLYLYESDRGTDEKYWSFGASTSNLVFRAWDDALSSATNFLLVNRTGITINSFTIAAPVVASSIDAKPAAGSVTTGTLTYAGNANKQVTATGNITMPASVFAAGDMGVVRAGGSARTITRGASLTMYVNGANAATATLSSRGIMGFNYEAGGVVYLTGDVS